MDFDREMREIHQRVNSNEIVVGWYSSSAEITMHSVLIHDYYSRLDPKAVFVTVDTELRYGRLGIKAHIRSVIGRIIHLQLTNEIQVLHFNKSYRSIYT